MQMPSQNPGLFRRTPPAIFPPIFGLFGLGLAWRRAVDGFPVSSALGDIILGGTTLLYLFALVAYGAKVIRRPGTVSDDLKTLPGRAGLAALMLAGMLLAASLATYSTALAKTVLVLAVLGHSVIVGLILRDLIRGPKEVRHVTPIWHLTFVGYIISPIAAIPLGFQAYSTFILAVTFVFAVLIWGISLRQMMKKEMPAPLRPTLAIHLSPASVLGTVAYLLGYTQLGFALGLFAIVVLAWLVLRVRWVTAGGFSALWGAFTFPLAAFSTLMQIMGSAGEGEVFRILGGLALVAASLIVPYVTYRIMTLWAKGMLAVKTNASEV